MQSLTRTGTDLLVLAESVSVAYLALMDIRSGVSWIGTLSRGDSRTAYTRSADPVGYWILIALHAGLATGMFIGSLGELLGFWHIPG